MKKLLLPIAFLLAMFALVYMAYHDSHAQQEIRKRNMALSYVEAHNCKLVETFPAQDSYDYSTGKVDFKPGRSKFQCAGLENAISIFEPQKEK